MFPARFVQHPFVRGSFTKLYRSYPRALCPWTFVFQTGHLDLTKTVFHRWFPTYSPVVRVAFSSLGSMGTDVCPCANDTNVEIPVISKNMYAANAKKHNGQRYSREGGGEIVAAITPKFTKYYIAKNGRNGKTIVKRYAKSLYFVIGGFTDSVIVVGPYRTNRRTH